MIPAGDSVPKIINVNDKKADITDDMTKNPLFFLNDDYFGIARFKGRHGLHRHDQDELFYVLDGHLTIEVNKEIYELDPGDAILIEAGEEHVSMCEKPAHLLIFEPQAIKTINVGENWVWRIGAPPRKMV